MDPAERCAPSEGRAEPPARADGSSVIREGFRVSDEATDGIDADAPVDRGPLRGEWGEWGVLLAIAVGGIIGAESRYGIDRLVPANDSGFPWATFIINVSGCLLMGALMVLLTELLTPHRLLRPFLGIGILGGFTTFSGFTVDTVALVDGHRAGLAVGYVLATLVAAAAALALGTVATRWLGRRAVW
jgi:CrcB protein